MSSGSGQDFIKRNRPPRVQISYQDPLDAEKQIEIPFVMGVLSDLSGNASTVEKPPIAERTLLDIDMDNFGKRMAAIQPAMAFRVPNRLSEGDGGEQLQVKLTFSSMDDFGPAAVARQVPELAALLEARTQLANLLRYMDGRVSAEEALRTILNDPRLAALARDRRQALTSTDTAPGEPGQEEGQQ